MTPQEEIAQLKAHHSAQLQQLGGRVAQLEEGMERAAARLGTLTRRISNAGSDDLAELGERWTQEARALLRPVQEQANKQP